MDIEIRPIATDEFSAFHQAVEGAFGHHVRPEETEIEFSLFEEGRWLAAFDGPELVGGAASYSLELTIPGAVMPMAGITGVGVLPSHRRRGVLTTLMRRQLDDLHESGEALAGLWASEGSIYGRFGYGVAAFGSRLEIDRHRTAFARSPAGWDSGRMRILDREAALEKEFPPIFDRIRREYPGFVSRGPSWWSYIFHDLERYREGASPYFFALHEPPEGEADGYVIYRVKPDWQDGAAGARVMVEELMAATPEAYAALWRYCFDIDLVAKIEAWKRPVDEALLLILAEPRRLRQRVSETLWLRPVDLAGALTTRRYGAEGRIVFDVTDAFCPWNEGRYELETGPDGAGCSRTKADPDVMVDATDLGSAFLGGVSFRALARAARVFGATPGALARADAMFGSDPRPWCPNIF